MDGGIGCVEPKNAGIHQKLASGLSAIHAAMIIIAADLDEVEKLLRLTVTPNSLTPKSGAPQASPEFSCYIFISRKADFKSKTVFSAPSSSYIDKLDSKHSRAALTLPSSRFTAPILYLASPTPSL